WNEPADANWLPVEYSVAEPWRTPSCASAAAGENPISSAARSSSALTRTILAPGSCLAESNDRPRLHSVGQDEARAQPVPDPRSQTLRDELVRPRGNQLRLLRQAPASLHAQPGALQLLSRDRGGAVVILDVHGDDAIRVDELDRDRIVAPAHDAAVLRLVVAMGKGNPGLKQQSKQHN